MITAPQAAEVTAFLRDCRAIAARDFYQNRPEPAAVWVFRWLSALMDLHAAGANAGAAVKACRSNQFSTLRMEQKP